MKFLKWTGTLCCAVLLFVCVSVITVSAATVSQNNLEVSLTADKEIYDSNEQINIQLVVTNTGSTSVDDVVLTHVLPTGFVLAEETNITKDIGVLEAGEACSFSITYLSEDACTSEDSTKVDITDENVENDVVETDTDSSNSANDEDLTVIESSTKNDSADTQEESTSVSSGSPSTGDRSDAVWVGLIMISGAAIIVLAVKRREMTKRLLAVLLCISLIGGMCVSVVPSVEAAEAGQGTISVSTTVNVGGKELEIEAFVTYQKPDVEESESDADNDGLTDEEEEILSTDKNNPDTDGDGFTDFEEVYLMGTDPLVPNDPDVDTDGDGLTDGEEVWEYGTDINLTDSDSDGLTDYDEIYVYSTDPVNEDTDGDGLTDGFEVEHGLDPTQISTNGTDNDGDILIRQELGKQGISVELRDDENLAKPTLEGEATGEMTDYVFLSSSDDSAFEDNRAVVGLPVDIDAEDGYAEGLTLHFDVSSYEGDISELCICTINENGEFELVETETEEDLSCTIDGDGIYFVLNIDEFLKMLGIDLGEFIDSYQVSTVAEEGEPSLYLNATDKAGRTTATADVKGQADIVFVIDTTGSMYNVIQNVIENVSDFAVALSENYNVQINFGLIDFKDLEEDGAGTTVVVKNGSSNWFSDTDSFIKKLSTLSADGGGDTDECDVDALETARQMDWRSSADKFVILITDAGYKIANDYGIESMEEEIGLLKADGINVSVVTSSYLKSDYQSLYETTGGIYANIYDDFSTVLMSLADLIGEKTSDGVWVILSHGYRYVKLPELPTASSESDYDGDGLTDYYELGAAKTVNLNAFILFELTRAEIPYEVYNGVKTITVHEAYSDPTSADTDGDGITDMEDTAPWAKGLADGIIGRLYLVTCYGSTFTSGHSFFAYESYVNDSINFSGLVNGWSRTDTSQSWTYSNITRDSSPTSSYNITPGEFVTIGNGALGSGILSGTSDGSSDGSSAGDANGVNYNMETAKFLAADRPTESGEDFSYLSNTYIVEEITNSSLKKLVTYLSQDSVNYWSLGHNCAKVAADGWNHISSTKVSAYGTQGWYLVATPSALRDNLRTIDEHKENWQISEAFQ